MKPSKQPDMLLPDDPSKDTPEQAKERKERLAYAQYQEQQRQLAMKDEERQWLSSTASTVKGMRKLVIVSALAVAAALVVCALTLMRVSKISSDTANVGTKVEAGVKAGIDGLSVEGAVLATIAQGVKDANGKLDTAGKAVADIGTAVGGFIEKTNLDKQAAADAKKTEAEAEAKLKSAQAEQLAKDRAASEKRAKETQAALKAMSAKLEALKKASAAPAPTAPPKAPAGTEAMPGSGAPSTVVPSPASSTTPPPPPPSKFPGMVGGTKAGKSVSAQVWKHYEIQAGRETVPLSADLARKGGILIDGKGSTVTFTQKFLGVFGGKKHPDIEGGIVNPVTGYAVYDETTHVTFKSNGTWLLSVLEDANAK